MDDYKIALGALLDANAKGDINKQLNAIKDLSVTISKATLSNDVINDIKRQLTQNGIDLKLVFGNVGQITSQAKQTGQQIGQQINQGISQSINNSTGLLNTFKLSLQNIGMGSKEIDAVANRIQNLGVQIESLNQSKSHSIGKNGKDILSVDISGTDSLGQAIKLTEQYNIATGELIRSIDAVSTAQQKSSANTSSFVKQQSQAVSNLTNQINQLNRSAIDQNASRPISDATHLNNLSTAYNDIISAINKMGNASSNAFTTEKNNVKTLISDFKSLVSEYRNAENVSIKMKGTDITSGIAIATNDFEKFKAEAKDFPQITQTINNLNSAISNVADASSLNSFNDQLRIARSELSKIKSETSTLNKEEKVGINISNLKAQISDLQRISPVINTFEAYVNGAKTTIQSLLDDLTRVNTQSDFSVVNSKWKAFTNSAKSAGIAITETISKADNLSDIVKNITQSYENGTYDAKVESIITKTRQWVDEQDNARISTATLQSSLEKLSKAYIDLNSSGGYTVENQKKLKQAESELSEEIKKVTNEITKMNAEYAKSSKVESFNQKLTEFYDKNSATHKKWGTELKQMMDATAYGAKITNSELINMERRFTQIGNEARQAGKLGLSFFDSIKEQAKKFTQWVSVTSVVMEGVQAFRKATSNVIELDTKMVELSKVSDLTAQGLENVTNQCYDLGESLSKTGTDVLDAVTTFKRAGYDITDSMKYAEEALKTANISENLKDASQNASSLVNIMKGFQDETPEFAKKINDAVNQVSNTEAVNFDNLIDGATRLSAVADQAGLSFEQMLGTLTGGYEILGNMEKVATGQITIFSRLQAIQLDGEEEVSTVAKLQEKFNNATKGAVDIVDQTSGQLRNVYDILDDLAGVWDTLDKNTREALAIEAAGIRQKQVFLALMQNWKGVEDAVESAKNSLGSADEENEKYINSISGRYLPRYVEIYN